MKRELKRRDNETLDEWCSRIAYYMAQDNAKYVVMKTILREVSVESYIHGSNDALKSIKR